ncbi:unnamed protein product [Vicia faba]|uniref:Uncharacterized protein n=1 Tax=Vicia faba TaxID=3906 RepID=A0AAV1AF84_VICFA|nr:unnamed protein product [Vicia faba]
MSSILHSLILLSLITLPLALGISSERSNKEVTRMYEKWIVKHQKVYNGLGEKKQRFEKQRFEIFKDNLKFIDEHNAENHTYKVGLNKFADMSDEEYYDNDILPESESVDWRWAVGSIKDQGECGKSCWAFSTVAAVEAINKIVIESFRNLFVQELVDCDRTKSTRVKGVVTRIGSCGSCWAFSTIATVEAIHKIVTGKLTLDQHYPYKGFEGRCYPTRKNAKIKAVAHQPVSVAIEASGRALQLYQSGVFTGKCGTNLDHAVVVVGYGSENGVDYWLVRNSWGGTNWGEDGYFKMERNVKRTYTGKCGIAVEASYPVKYGQNSAVTTNSAYKNTEVLVSSA